MAVEAFLFHPDLTISSYARAAMLIQGILGWEWFDKHLSCNSATPFFHMHKLEEEGESTIDRTIALGEMLFNLNEVEGFETVTERMKQRPWSPEDGFCELEVGKLLFLWNRRFRFIEPTGTKGSNYDIEIIADKDGPNFPVEAKCKVETTTLTRSTILNALRNARKQLPKDGKGYIFLKVPQTWILKGLGQDEEAIQLIRETIEGFLTGTRRVISVVAYAFSTIQERGGQESAIKLQEFRNPHLACICSPNLVERQGWTNPAWQWFPKTV